MVQIASALLTDPSYFFEGASPNDAAGASESVNDSRRPSDDPRDSFMATRAGIEMACVRED